MSKQEHDRVGEFEAIEVHTVLISEDRAGILLVSLRCCTVRVHNLRCGGHS